MDILLYVQRTGHERACVEVPSAGVVGDVLTALGLDRGYVSFQGSRLDPKTTLADAGVCPECTVEVVDGPDFKFVRYNPSESAMRVVRSVEAGQRFGADGIGRDTGSVRLAEDGLSWAVTGDYKVGCNCLADIDPPVDAASSATVRFDMPSDGGSYHYVYARSPGQEKGVAVRVRTAGEYTAMLREGKLLVRSEAEGEREGAQSSIELPSGWKTVILGVYLYDKNATVTILP
eukprot:TRINITY_DN976_c0_g1_i2.p1 TRINITY_DN976_c0_g1~~TRINITY_DN976_c0_g1_i2.p1  ORF type:complete len:251 (+),score=69.55 TRINITY_DN976_c0_g1_i2:59-754(+)